GGAGSVRRLFHPTIPTVDPHPHSFRLAEEPARLLKMLRQKVAASAHVFFGCERPFGKHRPGGSARVPENEAPPRLLEAIINRPGQSPAPVAAAKGDRLGCE